MNGRILAAALAVAALAGCTPHSAPVQTRPPVASRTPSPTGEPPTPGLSATAADADGVQDEASTASATGYPCRDGTVSHAKHRQGACAHHGGIA